jgi:hypothetical protein
MVRDGHAGCSEKEASRSMIRGKSSKMGPSEMAGIDFCSEGETNQVDWRETMVADLVVKTEPHQVVEVPSSLRGSVDACSIRQVLPHWLVSSMWKVIQSLLP